MLQDWLNTKLANQEKTREEMIKDIRRNWRKRHLFCCLFSERPDVYHTEENYIYFVSCFQQEVSIRSDLFLQHSFLLNIQKWNISIYFLLRGRRRGTIMLTANKNEMWYYNIVRLSKQRKPEKFFQQKVLAVMCPVAPSWNGFKSLQ